MEPTVSGGDDGIRIGAPDEGFGRLVVFGDEAVDGGLEVDEGAEHAAFQTPFGEFGKEALDRVEPGGRGRGEVEHPARVALEPLPPASWSIAPARKFATQPPSKEEKQSVGLSDWLSAATVAGLGLVADGAMSLLMDLLGIALRHTRSR